MRNSSKNILSAYLRRLTNLSGNNRSLLLLRLYAEQLMDLHAINHLNAYPSFEVIRALIAGRDVKLCQILDSRVESNNEISKRLKKLQRVDHFLFEEKGSNDLHVGWPFLRGKFSDGTLVRCPLLFFPVTLVQSHNNWYLHPRQHAGITLNKSFLLAYAHYNKVTLQDELLDVSFEDFNVDSTIFRTELYQLLRDKLEINFNADNFRDELIAFKEFKKDDFDIAHGNGELKLFPEAVLGIFPQADSQLVPDYLHLIEHNADADLESFFTDRNFEEEAQISQQEKRVREEKLYTPFTLDAYQENAIKSVKSGKSIVVQGPPGTGKSQLICNLMADAIASGRKALLVCQKRAALDVVYQRLQALDLGDFVGLVHDFRNERKNIFSKIARQIDNVENFKTLNRSIDVIQTERRFFQVCRSIDQITEELDDFKKALFDDIECGLSIKELYLTSELQGQTINIRQEYQYFTFFQLPDFLNRIKSYAAYAKEFETSEYLLHDRKSFAGYAFNDLKELERVISDVPALQKQISRQIADIISVSLSLEECESLRMREEDILGLIALLKNDIIYQYMQAMIGETDDETSLLWFANVERVLSNCYDGLGPESSLATEELGKFQQALHRRMDAGRNLFRKLRWQLSSKDKQWIHQVLDANQLPHNKKGLVALEQKIDSRLNLEHHLTALKQKTWLINLPQQYNLESFKTWFDQQKLAIRAKLVMNTLREIKSAVNPLNYKRNEFNALLKNLLSVVQMIPERKARWAVYLTPYQIRQLIHEPLLEKEYLAVLRKDFDSLCEFDRLKHDLKSYERDVLNKLHETVGEWNYQALESLLQNSLRLAWIEHIEAKHPNLRSVSSRKMDKDREELLHLVEEKQKLSRDILLLRARERVYESAAYNRLNNMVTYRDLYHQVTKKKKVWPLRKVIQDFEHELFQVMPCWMASPESVSAIFPMKQMFDLIIFDEASQCFSERGIPAMYRGKQILIAGDDKQLKPNELYQIRWEEDADTPDLEVDSLLDLAKRYLPTVHLQGHYRSQSLELIDFSNRYFYEGRLQLLPDRHNLNTHEPGITYINVHGIWQNNTNAAEAEEVVNRVTALLAQYPEKEIGVVTFNAPQQNLIMDLLEEEFTDRKIEFPATLFVKNIENVQGDEKDIIIFSVGYAKDKAGKMSMSFGSLSMPGGENRLNVAITRAREKIILVCSVSHEELHTEELKNEGPKLLKKYLEFAEQLQHQKFQPFIAQPVRQQGSWYLNRQIKKWGEEKFNDLKFEMNTLPLADLSIRSNGEHLGVVLTDDVHYFTSLSVKDTFAYAPALLTKRNWDYHFVFSRNLWQDKEKVEDDLLRFIGTKIKTT